MDTKVKEFLEEARAKERKAFERKRDEHLISLGLIKETKKEYSDYYSYTYSNYDDETKKYYQLINVPVEVSDDEYEEIKKFSAPTTPVEEIDNGAEKFLGVMNGISFAVCLITAVILLFVGMGSYRDSGYYYLASVVILLTSLVSWAIVKVLLNISNNLHNINHKQK